VILKLDFEKVFDKVEHEVILQVLRHEFILQVLRHKGFPQKWIKEIMGYETSSVILNGAPEKVFHCRRGVR
jgi:hypothetical protein